jgi:hypothetical protein
MDDPFEAEFLSAIRSVKARRSHQETEAARNRRDKVAVAVKAFATLTQPERNEFFRTVIGHRQDTANTLRLDDS